MYKAALAEALEKGPRKAIVNGTQLAAFFLYRSELDALYEDNHFVTDTRSTWLKHISKWPKYGAVVPSEDYRKLQDMTGNWIVLFGYIDKDHWQTLRKYAEDNDCKRFPEWAEGVGQ